jgi:hypothetical protein
MSNAHKGSRLILKDQLIATNFNSTHFDYNVDATGICFGELVEPSVGSIYTQKPIEGKFGGGVAVEEGTTNLAIISDSRWMLNKSNYQGIMTLTDYDYFNTSMLYNFKPRLDPSGGGWQVAGYSHGTTFTSGSAHTWSIYLRKLTSDNLTVRLVDSNAANQQGATVIFTGNVGEWNRIQSTWTPTVNTGGAWFYVSANETASFELADPQIEKKAFPTSFTVGTRYSGSPIYDAKKILNPYRGSVSFWFNPLSRNPEVYPSLFTAGAYSADNSQDWLCVYYGSGWSSGNQMTLGITGKGSGAFQVSSLLTIIANKWYFVVARWDRDLSKGVLRVYRDDGTYADSIVGNYNFTPPSFTDVTNLYIGKGWGSPNTVNGMFSDIVIDREYISDDEMNARYFSNKPMYNPYDYRSFSY